MVESLVEGFGDGANQSELVRSMVNNNIVRKGPVLFGEYTPGAAIKKAVSLKPEDVIEEVKISKDRDASEWQRIEAESRNRLDRLCEILRQAGIESEPHLAAGDKVSEILRLSDELNSTMTILGTTAKDRIQAFFQGSLSQEVAQASELPTLLIP